MSRADKGWAMTRARPRKKVDVVDWDQIMDLQIIVMASWEQEN